jgi:hypothetical protein
MMNNIQPKKREKKMLPAIRQLITTQALNDRDKDRNVLAEELINDIKRKYPKEIPPSFSTIIKKISEDRSLKNINPLDEPWHLGILNRIHELNINNINAESIYYINRVKSFVDNTYSKEWIKNTKSFTGITPWANKHPFLSIRQAKWVAYLYRIADKNIRHLYGASFIYSEFEIVCEISGTIFDTSDMDTKLSNWSDFKKLLDECANNNHSKIFQQAFNRSLVENIQED